MATLGPTFNISSQTLRVHFVFAFFRSLRVFLRNVRHSACDWKHYASGATWGWCFDELYSPVYWRVLFCLGGFPHKFRTMYKGVFYHYWLPKFTLLSWPPSGLVVLTLSANALVPPNHGARLVGWMMAIKVRDLRIVSSATSWWFSLSDLFLIVPVYSVPSYDKMWKVILLHGERIRTFEKWFCLALLILTIQSEA